MRRQRNTFQMKEKEKKSEKEINVMEKSNLPDQELKVTAVKMLTKLKEEWKNSVRFCVF